MSKRTNNQIQDWREVIERASDEREKTNQLLTPSRDQTKYIVEFTRSLYYYAQRMSMAHDLARDKVVDVEVGQKIINAQLEMLNKTKRNLDAILEEDTHERD